MQALPAPRRWVRSKGNNKGPNQPLGFVALGTAGRYKHR